MDIRLEHTKTSPLVTFPPGASYTFRLLFSVAGGNTAPPDGTTIGLNLIDTARAGSVSRGVVVRTMPPLNLQLSTEQGTVAPGETFTYTLTCANVSATARNGVTLSAPVPREQLSSPQMEEVHSLMEW